MKLEVFQPIKTKKTVFLDLRSAGDGAIVLCAVDESGSPLSAGCLLYFEPSGHIARIRNVDPSLGFKLDKKGRIVVGEY